jgi:hypothetical protein
MSRAVALAGGGIALIVLVVAVLVLGADDDGTSSTPLPSGDVEAPSGSPPSAGDLGALPPGFVGCMAQQGYEIQSSADIHSAPPDVLQACFGAAH